MVSFWRNGGILWWDWSLVAELLLEREWEQYHITRIHNTRSLNTFPRHTSYITNHLNHKSHITTSHVPTFPRHTSSVTRRTSHVTHHTSHVTRHKSYITHSNVTYRKSHSTYRKSYSTYRKSRLRRNFSISGLTYLLVYIILSTIDTKCYVTLKQLRFFTSDIC